MGIDQLTPNPETPKRFGYSFIEAVGEGFFHPEDQADVEYAIGLYTWFVALGVNNRSAVRNTLNEFVWNLTPEEDSRLRKANIFHLFYGSGRTEERWRSHRLHTEDGKFEAFLKETIEPLIKSYEQKSGKSQ